MTTPSEPPQAVEFRSLRPEDADFFFKGWLDAYGLGSPMTIHVPKSVFYPAHRALIGRLLQRPAARVVVASLREDPAVLIGFAAGELGAQPVLHFVYTKAAFRRMGIGRGLLAALGVDPDTATFTHWTRDTTWLQGKFPKARFNPYLLEDSSWTPPK